MVVSLDTPNHLNQYIQAAKVANMKAQALMDEKAKAKKLVETRVSHHFQPGTRRGWSL